MDATEYKADEIALSLARLYLDDYGDGEDTVDTKTYERCRQAALEMAKYKDEQYAFKHPIGSKVWWVGMEHSEGLFGYEWKKREREVTSTRIITHKGKTYKNIFLSGLTSYEGENWFEDEIRLIKEYDGTEFLCSEYMCDAIFDTEEEADRYLQWELTRYKNED